MDSTLIFIFKNVLGEFSNIHTWSIRIKIYMIVIFKEDG